MQSLILMASKNVALRLDLVRRLDRAKRPGESYSDVIGRHLEDKESFIEVVRFLREHPMKGPDTLSPRLRKIRKEMNESFERRWRRLEKML